MRPLPFLAVVIGLVVPATSWADLIRLRAGGTLKGKILKRTASEVVVQLEFGTMSFMPDEITAVDAESTPEPQPTRPPIAVPIQQEVTPTPQGVIAIPLPPQTVSSPTASPGMPKTVEPSQRAEEPADVTLPNARKAVAFIGVAREDGTLGFGSGTIINTKGTMVTNYHVVAGATGVAAMLVDEGGGARKNAKGSRSYEARVLKVDGCYDLALVTIPVKTPQYLRFANDDEIRVGDEVRAVGNPQGLAISVSKGIVSGIRTAKDLGIEDMTVPGCEHLSDRVVEAATWLQTDAAINPGNSGGPLLNTKLEIVGINTLMLSESGGSVGLNFALHVKHVRSFVGSYAEKGK